MDAPYVFVRFFKRVIILKEKHICGKQFSASAFKLWENALWVTGGIDENENYLASTEFIGENGYIYQGPRLPKAISSHTVVQVGEYNDNYGWVDSIIIGGWSPESGATENTHFLIYVDSMTQVRNLTHIC